MLSRYAGQPLSEHRHENNIWVRHSQDGPWVLDLTVSHGTADTWVYRRDDQFRLPWDAPALHTKDGIPYLAPELQLLYKAVQPRAKDDVGARVVIPTLPAATTRPLSRHLPSDHS